MQPFLLAAVTRCKIFALLLVAGLFFLPQSAAARTVRAGLEQNPPLSYIDEQGNPAGLLVDLLNLIAAREGWEVRYAPDTFERCLEKLNNGEIDLMVTIAYSKERAESYDFNKTNIISNWGQLYTLSGKKIESYFDLEGKTIAVMRRDTHHRAFRSMLDSFGIHVNYLEVDNFNQVFVALQRHQADAGVVGRFFAMRAEERYEIMATPIIFNPIEVHYAVRKGANGDLLQGIDRNLQTLKADPSSHYYSALAHWLGGINKPEQPQWLKPAATGVFLLLSLLAVFILILRREVRQRTAHLEREIVERSRAEAAKLESEQNYRELVEGASAIILRFDPNDLSVTFINDYGVNFFGFSREEILGHSILTTIVPSQESDGRDLVELLKGIGRHPEEHLVNENENVRKNGERVWISWHNRPILDADGKVICVLSVGQDVTERKKAEEARRLFDRAKDDFISTAAHELRTPLTSIMGYAELLCGDAARAHFSAAERDEFARVIYAKGEILSRIIDELLDISRIQRGVPLPLHCQQENPTTMVAAIVEQFETTKPQHRFRYDFARRLPDTITCDRDRITQVLENLLSNAIKYSAQGSTITTSIAADDRNLRICVTDQGIGMTPEQVERMFDKFYRADSSDTAVGGLGLGMSIARQIVESHGGAISVTSTPGVGTSACFTLPLVNPAS